MFCPFSGNKSQKMSAFPCSIIVSFHVDPRKGFHMNECNKYTVGTYEQKKKQQTVDRSMNTKQSGLPHTWICVFALAGIATPHIQNLASVHPVQAHDTQDFLGTQRL